MSEHKLTEDETVKLLMKYLKFEDWEIESFCLGQQRGFDIVAIKEGKMQIIEVKGARASNDAPTKKREHFNKGQIRIHFGVAIIKALKTKREYPQALIAIAHPNDQLIKDTIGNLIVDINKMGIIHYWVNPDGTIFFES